MTRVAVIGGGIAGLTAAHHLRARGCDAIVLEKSHRAGGLIETERADGYVFEHGPDGFLASRGNVLEEIGQLELDDEIVTGGPAPRRAYIAAERGLVEMPGGLFRFERRALGSVLMSPLLSRAAKLRLLTEPLVPRSGGGEENVEAFFTRRLGPEVARCIVDPMFRGIYGAPTSALGMRSAMPKLSDMETRFGSVGLALLLARRAPPSAGLVTLRRGMSTLVDRISTLLGASLVTNADVTQLRRVGGGSFRLEGRFGVFDADGVVLACPAHAASRLVEPFDIELAAELASIPFSRADVVGLAYPTSVVPTETDGTGFVVGPDARLDALMACTWSSSKWPHRAPDEHVLLRCVSQTPHASDRELVELVRSDLRRAMGIEASPDHLRIRRHARALPTYRPGHQALVASIRRRADALGNIQLAGNAYDGIGVPDCMASGRRAGLELTN